MTPAAAAGAVVFAFLLCAVLAFYARATAEQSAPPEPDVPRVAVAAAPSPTPTATPFQPMHPTPTTVVTAALPTLAVETQDATTPQDIASLPTAAPTRTMVPLTGRWHGIDFNDPTRRIEMTIPLTGSSFNDGQPLTFGFQPGDPCTYADFRACINLYQGSDLAVIFATVHSGVGGDAQPLRHALEGTGFNQAGQPLVEIHNRMESLVNVPVLLRQGETSTEKQRVRAAARVPPDQLSAYFASTIPDALALVAQHSPQLARALNSRKPMLVIETCGWWHLEEAGIPGATGSTGSVYLLVIQ